MHFKKTNKLNKETPENESVIYNMPGCVYWKDRAGVYLGCNKIFLEMVGLNSADEVVGKTDKDFCWANQEIILRENDKKVMRFGSMRFEEKVTLADYNEFTYAAIKSPLHNDQGKIMGIIGTSIDITPYKKMEAALIKQAGSADKAQIEFTFNRAYLPKLGHIDSDLNYLPLIFSEREKECIKFMLSGNTMREIGDKLLLSRRTVEAYMENIKNKLGCNKKSELIKKLLKNGFMPDVE